MHRTADTQGHSRHTCTADTQRTETHTADRPQQTHRAQQTHAQQTHKAPKRPHLAPESERYVVLDDARHHLRGEQAPHPRVLAVRTHLAEVAAVDARSVQELRELRRAEPDDLVGTLVHAASKGGDDLPVQKPGGRLDVLLEALGVGIAAHPAQEDITR